jgi:molybdate transport system permease protein
MFHDLDLSPLWLTLKEASLATLASFLGGVVLAYLIARRQFWGRDWLDAVSTLPPGERNSAAQQEVMS